jgi:hypothetical protein
VTGEQAGSQADLPSASASQSDWRGVPPDTLRRITTMSLPTYEARAHATDLRARRYQDVQYRACYLWEQAGPPDGLRGGQIVAGPLLDNP